MHRVPVEAPCPTCGDASLHVEYRLEAQTPGTYSLAGVQMKISATEYPYLVCDACGVEARAKESA